MQTELKLLGLFLFTTFIKWKMCGIETDLPAMPKNSIILLDIVLGFNFLLEEYYTAGKENFDYFILFFKTILKTFLFQYFNFMHIPLQNCFKTVAIHKFQFDAYSSTKLF